MKAKRLITSCLLLLGLAAFAAGCNEQQLSQAQADVSTLQSQLKTAQANAGAAQAQIDQIGQQIAAQKAILTTRPTDADAQSTLAGLEDALNQQQTILDGFNQQLPKIEAALKQVQDFITALQTQKAPNTSSLGAFGPYGELAGLAITLGWAVYAQVKNNQKAGQLQTLVSATGTATHADAVATAVQAVAALAQSGSPAAPGNPSTLPKAS